MSKTKKFSKKLIRKLRYVFCLKNNKEVFNWLETNRSDLFGWKLFSDLSEQQIKTEFQFKGHIFE
jgi:hypothetical protein